MPAILAFKSDDEKNPFIVFSSDVICLEENEDKTISYWFTKWNPKDLYFQKTHSTFDDCGNCVENFVSNHSGNVTEIITFDKRVIYILNDYLKTDEMGNILLPSSEILSNVQTKPALS